MSSSILITGASKGIGRAIAKELSDLDKTLFLVGRNQADLKSLQVDLKGPSQAFICDLSCPNQIKLLLLEVQEFLKSGAPLKGIVNNAGIFQTQKSEEQRHDLWQAQMQINFLSAVQITEGLIPLLKESGPSWILNISSSLSTRPSQNTGAYGASKAALNHWTQTLAIELGPYQVRANALCPGIVDTPIHPFHHLPESEKQIRISKMSNLQPLRRIGSPDDIAKAARFFCSSDSSWVTGSILNIDGGINLV